MSKRRNGSRHFGKVNYSYPRRVVHCEIDIIYMEDFMISRAGMRHWVVSIDTYLTWRHIQYNIQGPLLPTWFNFNPCMDNLSNPSNYLS